MKPSAPESAIASIILCAGRGRRMLAPRTPKVCTPIGGQPAIVRLLECHAHFRFDPIVLVVGHLAQAVIDEVGPRFPRVLFAFQHEQHGTGHAARQGAAVLSNRGFTGSVLVMAGDKVIEPRALQKLIDSFRADLADLALIVKPIADGPSSGRVVTDKEGRVLRIIELADLRAAEVSGRSFEIDGVRLSARDVGARITWVNQGVYLFRADALYEALENLGRDNVQGEEYLTDTVAYLRQTGKHVIPVPTDDSGDVLGFNDPAELLEIEEHLRRRAAVIRRAKEPLDQSAFRPPTEWVRRLRRQDPPVQTMLRDVYGDNAALCEEKRRRLLEAVELFIERFGTTGQIVVVRAPGRLNLMGRHIDHRGGRVNLMAIDREQIVVARPRDDSVVRARNADDKRFPDLEFSIDDLLRRVRLDDWRGFISNETVVEMVRDLRGDWGNYLKAPMLRLQQEFKDRRIRGLDCVVGGDIPMAAGLSSSSALVVAMAEALVLANRLDVAAREFVNVCGEGEWFVGTRGGTGDHAAIKLSRSGQVAHIGFFPFMVCGYAKFPENHVVVVCDSRVQARKSAEALDAFNERIASCELAVRLVRKRFPGYAPRIEHLRDISPERLAVSVGDIYRILKEVPEVAAADELRAELGRHAFEEAIAGQPPQGTYRLRARLLYGIAECERSKRFFRLLQDGRMQDLGQLMIVSHNGDRVVARDGRPVTVSVGDPALEACIRDLNSRDAGRLSAAQLWMQPGGYGCSLPQIDRMVDIALTTPGVLGAQLAGAGFGGCIMVLARSEAASDIVRRMNEDYYEPENLEPGAMIVTPIAGCSALRLDRDDRTPGLT
jgi:N-acetylgalactosamine kinase